jgi:hypothetical protein
LGDLMRMASQLHVEAILCPQTNLTMRKVRDSQGIYMVDRVIK